MMVLLGSANFVYVINPVLVEVGPTRLWYYGLAYAIGLLTVDLWVWLKRERLGFDRRDVAEFSLLFAAGVLLGGRIFDVASTSGSTTRTTCGRSRTSGKGAWRPMGSCLGPSSGR
jgi:prolipoprotein diacylglyceryltransferase